MLKENPEMRNEIVIGCIILLLLTALNNVIFPYMSSHVMAEYLGDKVVYQNLIYRMIKLNDIEIIIPSADWKRYVEMSNETFSWTDINGTPKTVEWFIIHSSPISYYDTIFLEPNEYGIDKSKIFDTKLVLSGKKVGYCFLVNYTGEYFHETIVFGYYVTGDLTYVSKWKEINRTDFLSYNETQLYNPSIVIYKAVSLLLHYKLPFRYIHKVLLVPKNLLNSTFKNHEFIWVVAISDCPYYCNYYPVLRKLTPDLKLDMKHHRVFPITRYIFYFDENKTLLDVVIKSSLYVSVATEL